VTRGLLNKILVISLDTIARILRPKHEPYCVIMNSSDQLEKANEIGRKILSGETVSEAEYRYMVMFNLTAITQLLWELSSQTKQSEAHERNIQGQSGMDQKDWTSRFIPVLVPLAGFLAGLGIGYLIP
jgi:hypothetical protein